MQNKTSFTRTDIFTQIWTSPRVIFNYIAKKNNDNFSLLLLFLAGVYFSINNSAIINQGGQAPLIILLPSVILFGGIGGILSTSILAFLIYLSGKLFKAKGNFESILRIYGYAMLPGVIAFGVLIIQSLVQGEGVVQKVIFYGLVIIEIGLTLFSSILLIIGLSVIQKLSIWKSIITFISSLLIYFGTALILIWMFSESIGGQIRYESNSLMGLFSKLDPLFSN